MGHFRPAGLFEELLEDFFSINLINYLKKKFHKFHTIPFFFFSKLRDLLLFLIETSGCFSLVSKKKKIRDASFPTKPHLEKFA